MADLPKIDEFMFILLAGLILIFVLAFSWVTPAEGPPLVEESSFSIKAVPGEVTKLDFVVSGKTALTAINVTASGDIAEWVTFNKDNFDLSQSDSTTVIAKIEPPDDVELGIYNGRITLEGSGGKDTFSVTVEIVEEGEMASTTRLIPASEFPTEFSVVYAKGTDILDSKENVVVSTSYLARNSVTLTGLLTDDRMDIATGGSIQINVEKTNGFGNLIVIFNGEKIYDKKVGIGELLIPISTDLIERANVVEIKASTPGIVFWSDSRYVIKSANFNLNYEGAFAQSFNITLSDYEVNNFKRFSLFGRVKDHSSSLPEMMIKVNNQIVYWKTPPISIISDYLEEDMFGNPLYLSKGENTITFMFEKNAKYELTDAMLTVEYYE